MSAALPLGVEAGRITMRALKRSAHMVGITRGRAAAARMAAERYALAVGGRTRTRPGGRVLCYHSIGQPSYGVNDISPARFRWQIETALRAGYRFVPAEVIAETGGTPQDIAITFDDACKSVLTVGAPILSALELPWSVFVVSGWCEAIGTGRSDAYLSWDEIEALAAAGAQIGSHSVTHPDFGAISPMQAADELMQSRDTIGSRLGIVPTSFAIPLGQSMNWNSGAQRIAREAGYRTIYAQAVETRPAGTVARSFVTHFDDAIIFRGLLRGRLDAWEEWV